ncbi:hypothetical protein PMAYCL1PPCAC_02834 [Pristionchus mayeri]|uniref:Helicase n=1 Tax=Pristionchus mayeri TaxID=1317129 RepID=A0AAN4Z3W9_9BILA|nr:hypothetical protein PMAYCL1PPCAC_02834 [Pristionchus mayeri]
MSSKKTPRRRIIISSDEDSDVEKEDPKSPNDSDILSEDEIVNDSIASAGENEQANNDDDLSEDEVIDDSIVSTLEKEESRNSSQIMSEESDNGEEENVKKPSARSTPAMKTARGSLIASTPVNKKKTSEEDALNETFDRMSVGGRSAASRNLSNSSIDNNDRERSFHGREVEDSPISKRLTAQSDAKSKQALRERLLRKQAVAARGSPSHGSADRSSSSLVNSTLSPIGLKPIPTYKDDSSEKSVRSPVSDMDTMSPINKRSGSSEGRRSGEESMESSRGSNSSGTDKENGSPSDKKNVRKKLNMNEMALKKDTEEEKVRKFMTPRKTAKVEQSDEEEEEDVKTEAYPNIESDEEEVKEVKKERSFVEIVDSDEDDQKKKEDVVHIVDSDSEEQKVHPRLKEEQEDDAIVLSSSSPSPTRNAPARPMPSLSSSSLSTSTGLHPTTQKTLTHADIGKMEKDLNNLMNVLHSSGKNLPDGGAQLRRKIEEITTNIEIARVAQPARRVAAPAPKGRLQVISPPRNVEDGYNKIVVDDGLGRKKLTGGVMTDDRVANVKKITNDSLEKMHKEVTSQPEGEETVTPRGLRVELMGHQKTGLTWMLWRERQHAPGGILADDMGLGKTMSMISLVMHTKNERMEKENEEDEEYEKREAKYKKMCTERRLAHSHATLVIAPASVIFQWQAEIEKRVKGNRLNVLVFHGPKNKREDRAKKLAKYDVVITTYNIITSELTEKVNITNDDDGEDDSDDDDARFGQKAAVAGDGKKTRVSKSQISVLTKVHWERIILDEAHQIKNRNSLISKAVCRLPGSRRWCLTGTPVHNNLYDLFSLVRFLKVHPFDELTLWKENIMEAKNGGKRLDTLVKSLLLRRLKSQVDTKTNLPLVSLKPKTYEIHELTLDGLEKSIYTLMFKAVQVKVKNFMDAQKDKEDIDLWGRVRRRKNEKKGEEEEAEPVKNPFLSGPREINTDDKFQAMNCILVLLLRLRQAVVHLSLTKEAMDLSAFEELPMNTNQELLDAELSQLSLDETGGGELEEKLSTERDVERCFSQRFMSTKIRVLLDKLDQAVQSGDKCVVVSQWTSILKIVEYHIRRRDIEYTEITGEVATADRQERVDSFNRVGGGAQVMLLSLTAGGVGLNLIGGNHLFLVDLHWNPALEAQACDRIYRMGQTKNVYIHKLIAKHTIEETIRALQDKKSALAKSVLEGAANKQLNKLTMADLKFLFDLDGEQKRKEMLDEAAKKAMEQYPQGAAAAAAARAALPSTHSTAAYNYNNAVYGGPSRATLPSMGEKKEPEVITL